ncbi:LysR family transcriptional regulator [Actinoallomurus bryophytorum]|uniref:DNA-binding transcriptional LysR family regulator n=1 Tax=Actinoallomurus bryophytorum TaxID=1490222 RepID=A0A543CJ56_9ACTN|nr:LysR family transcriptional regulator [Actinoallomurus bryophytorum]TQL96937.1 DNA-binding transcriptional LysR family regulator [Actinoallomurus bryophytorum]
MEQREIEAFLTLADELHFGRTAERLHVSTARISQAIKTLERRVGAPLFERTSRRVALTPLGRRLHEDLRPAYQGIQEGLERAIAAGRGVDGVLRVGFVNAAAGRLILLVADGFRVRHPRCAVEIREVQVGDCLVALRAGEIDVLLATFPIEEADLTTGSVLLSEPRVLAVSSRHPFARRESVSLEDLARDEVLRAPCSDLDYWEAARVPERTPGGRPIERGQPTATFQEMLTLIGAGRGIYPVGAHATRYYTRPDVTYVPFRGAPPLEWGLIWRTSAETSRVRAFDEAARDVITARGGPEHDAVRPRAVAAR